MYSVIEDILAAHGGRSQWDQQFRVEATVVATGALWTLKGLQHDPTPRQVTASLRDQRLTLHGFGAPDQVATYTPGRVTIEKAGRTLAERTEPRRSFEGHEPASPWDPLHRAYFSGYAMWNALNTPFLLAMPAVAVEELPATKLNGQWLRTTRAEFPPEIATHSLCQEFSFDEDMTLRRHDFSFDIAGGIPATTLVRRYAQANGIRIPSHLEIFQSGPAGEPLRDAALVEIEITDLRFRRQHSSPRAAA